MANFEFKKGRSTIVGNQMDDVENADARTVLKTFHVRSITPAMVRFFEAKLGWLPFNLFAGINRQANEMTEALLTEIENKPLPPQIIQLLEQDLKKKEQVSLLKGVSLNKEQIGTLFLQAGKRGYKFSSYRFEGKPKQFDEKELPSFICHQTSSFHASLTMGNIGIAFFRMPKAFKEKREVNLVPNHIFTIYQILLA